MGGYTLDGLEISKLEVGMVVKNYKAMCELLGCKATSSKGRSFQFKKWKRYFDFEKQGHKFIITKIYEQPLPDTDAKITKWHIYIEPLLVMYLTCTNEHKFNKGQLYSILGMVNTNFSLLCSKPTKGIMRKRIDEHTLDVTDFDLMDFTKRAELKLGEILITSLKSMERRNVIKCDMEYIVCDSNDKYRTAKEDEACLIVQAQEQVISSMGYRNFADIKLFNKVKEYNSNLNDLLFEKYGYKKFYSQFNISCLQDDNQKLLHCELSPVEQRQKLNAAVLKYLDNQARDKYAKNVKEIESYENVEDIKFMYQNNYVEAQYQLSDYLIALNNSNDEYIKTWLEISKKISENY